MLNIRLQRVGRKNDPSFRVIVADSKLKPKTGNFLEVLGSYNARYGKPVINAERAKHWMSMGAKTSGTIHNILVDLKVVSGKKVNVLNKKTPIVKEQPVETAPVAKLVVEEPKAEAIETTATEATEAPAETATETVTEETKASE
jgi:small subunit ribosomal protein S16